MFSAIGEIFSSITGAFGGPLFLVLGILIFIFALDFVNIDPGPILSVVVALTPIWLPLGLFFVAYDRWMYFATNDYAAKNGRTTLRIKLPPEVFKSPEAMEAILVQTHNAQNPDNLMQTYLEGKSPLTNSLELVSIGGEVRFYVNVPTKKVKNTFEAQLYAQYPGIEVTQEDIDYTDEIRWDPEKYEYLAFHLGKKDEEVIPIKTYIDFGLDKLPKEEEKVEPMAPMLERLGAMKPHERIWIQFLCTPHVKKNFKNGSLFKEQPTWEAAAKKKINEIMKRDIRSTIDPDTYERAPSLTVGERDVIAAIERNTSKYAYEVGIRWIYITPKGKFDGDFVSGLLKSFSSYDLIGRNGINVKWRTDFNYKFFSDRSGRKIMKYKESELSYYKSRYFYPRDHHSGTDDAKVMSVEEIATMYHIPGSSIATPGLSRITSVRKDAPSNLPVGLLPQNN